MNLKKFRLNDEVVYVMSMIMFLLRIVYDETPEGAVYFWFGLGDIGSLWFEGFEKELMDYITLIDKHGYHFNAICGIEKSRVVL